MSIKNIIDSIPKSSGDVSVDDAMQHPEYLRESSAIISDALKNGYDVLQLENGDIVTTGTKVVVTQYHFNPEKEKMEKISSKGRKKK